MTQWAHFGAIGIWVGAVVGLLILVPRASTDVATLRLCSLGASVALGVVGVTGMFRAMDDIGSWSAFVATVSGRLVVLKTALFLMLGLLGAASRRLIVAQGRESRRRLYRAVAAELLIAVSALAVTAYLTGLAVPDATRQAARLRPALTVTGTTTRHRSACVSR